MNQCKCIFTTKNYVISYWSVTGLLNIKDEKKKLPGTQSLTSFTKCMLRRCYPHLYFLHNAMCSLKRHFKYDLMSRWLQLFSYAKDRKSTTIHINLQSQNFSVLINQDLYNFPDTSFTSTKNFLIFIQLWQWNNSQVFKKKPSYLIIHYFHRHFLSTSSVSGTF